MGEDYNRLRLKYHGDQEKLHEILQLECRDKCARKLPVTLSHEGFIFPSLALAEMCTSDNVAAIHAGIVGKNKKVLDMTAGLGIDSFHLAESGCEVTAVEMNSEAVESLRNNVGICGLSDRIEIIEGDSVAWLADNGRHFDVIFIDPARRDSSGRHVSLKQCQPDLTTCLPLLLSRAGKVIIKMSPMIDISSAKAELGIRDCDITVIGTNRECKEVVMTVYSDTTFNEGKLDCVTIGHETYHADISMPETATTLPQPGDYLMQPFPSVMKGTGGYIGGYSKLHQSTHLYVSKTLENDFPGQIFKISDILSFNKQSIKTLKNIYPKINVATRNFPLSAPELVKKLNIREGGDTTLFGVTLNDGKKALIICSKL